jgi:protease-4
MKRAAVLSLLLLGTVGCLEPLRTESKIMVEKPVPIEVTAELRAKDTTALLEMPVGPEGPRSTKAPRPTLMRALHGTPEGPEDVCGDGPRVAVLDVDGLLLNRNLTGPYSSGDNPVDLFRQKLDRAAADSGVCAVVVRINSPGGAVTASDVMWRDLQTFRAHTRKPVVACLMDLGCAGAYYLATASDVIIAHPTTVTGGIGVLLNLYNLEDFLNAFNIRGQFIKSGQKIDMGSLLRALDPETKRLLQRVSDGLHDRFKMVVRQQRPRLNGDEATLFDGRVMGAQEALERGLIDDIGYLDDAIEAARRLSGQAGARVVLFHRCNDVAHTAYATTANVPLQATFFPFNVPAADRSLWPTFLYMWEPDPSMPRLSGQ